MLFVRNSDLEWYADDSHGMSAGVHKNLPSNASADIMFARIDPGNTLPLHWHSRPIDASGEDSGYESFFFFQGGSFTLLRRNEEIQYSIDEPFTITFFSGIDDMHGIRNNGDKPLLFQVLCAPRFVETEEHMA